MRLLPLFATMSIVALLSACGGGEATCTEEQAQAKAETMMKKFQEVAASNPQKLAEVGPKFQEIGNRMQTIMGAGGEPTDAQKAEICKAMDEMIAELG